MGIFTVPPLGGVSPTTRLAVLGELGFPPSPPFSHTVRRTFFFAVFFRGSLRGEMRPSRPVPVAAGGLFSYFTPAPRLPVGGKLLGRALFLLFALAFRARGGRPDFPTGLRGWRPFRGPGRPRGSAPPSLSKKGICPDRARFFSRVAGSRSTVQSAALPSFAPSERGKGGVGVLGFFGGALGGPGKKDAKRGPTLPQPLFFFILPQNVFRGPPPAPLERRWFPFLPAVPRWRVAARGLSSDPTKGGSSGQGKKGGDEVGK